MVRFEEALDVRPLDNGRDWQVLEDFYYDSDVLCAGLPRGRCLGSRIRVPKGFITDFASIPRALWSLVGGPADGKYRKIAVVHDRLYRTFAMATRYQADRVLLEGMKFSGCSRLQRWTIYAGVRLGGWASYKGCL